MRHNNLSAWSEYDQNVWATDFPRMQFSKHGHCSRYTDVQGHCPACEKRGKSVMDLSCTNGFTCGNLVAPPEEVARFVWSLFKGKLLGEKAVNAMLDSKPLGGAGAPELLHNKCNSLVSWPA